MSTDARYQAPESDLAALNEEINTSYFSPRGRLSRLALLARYLIVTIISYLLIGLVIFAAVSLSGSNFENLMASEDFSAIGLIGAIPLVVIVVLMFVVSIFLTIKRLHDFNRSGWFSLVLLIPLVNVLFMLVLFFWPGSKSANRFGGVRANKTWEIVLGVIGLLFMIGSFAVPLLVGGMAGSGMGY